MRQLAHVFMSVVWMRAFTIKHNMPRLPTCQTKAAICLTAIARVWNYGAMSKSFVIEVLILTAV
jgi:hypothetical protein